MKPFTKYRYQADAYCPDLKIKSNPDDMAKIKDLYSEFSSRLSGLESKLDDCKTERIVITITKRGGIADGED